MDAMIYFILIADNIRSVANATLTITAGLVALGGFMWLMAHTAPYAKSEEINAPVIAVWKRIKWFIYIVMPLMVLIMMFVPDTGKLAGGYLATSIIENKELSEVPTKVFELLNIKLDDLKAGLLETEVTE